MEKVFYAPEGNEGGGGNARKPMSSEEAARLEQAVMRDRTRGSASRVVEGAMPLGDPMRGLANRLGDGLGVEAGDARPLDEELHRPDAEERLRR